MMDRVPVTVAGGLPVQPMTDLVSGLTYMDSSHSSSRQSSFQPSDSYVLPHGPGHGGYTIENEDYRQKCENMKLLLKEMQNRLRSYEIRIEGITTLSRFLQDERESNAKSRETIKSLQKGVTVLQSRLAKEGMPFTLNLEVGEFYAPSVPRQVFDSVVKDIAKLKDQLKYLPVDPAKLEQLYADRRRLEEQLGVQRDRLVEAEAEVTRLRGQLCVTPDDKDRRIKRLTRQIEDMEHNKQSQDILCQSLADQTKSLRQQLRETSEQCHKLLSTIDTHAKSESGTGTPVQAQAFGETPAQKLAGQPLVQGSAVPRASPVVTPPEMADEENSRLRMENDKQRNEILILEMKVKEVLEANKRWETYEQEQQAYIHKLRAKTAEELLTRSTSSSQVSSRQQEEYDKLVIGYKEKIARLEEEVGKVSDENWKLRREMVQVTERERELLAQTEAQEQQIKANMEDFASERTDRERAHSRIDELETNNRLLNQRLEAFQNQSLIRNQQRRDEAMRFANMPPSHLSNVPLPTPIQINTSQMVHRGPYRTDGESSGEDEGPDQGFDEVDRQINMPGLRMKSPAMTIPNVGVDSQDVVTVGGSPSGASLLSCPQCFKEFPIDKHGELLEHMDICCND